MTIKNKKWKRLIYGFVAAFALLSLFNILPAYYEVFLNVIKWIDLKSSKENIRDNDIKIKNNKNELILMKAKMNSMLTKIDDSQKVSPYIDEINSIADSAKISLASIKTQSLEKRENLLVQPLEIALEGNYFQLFEFIKSLERTKRTFVIKKTLIKPGEDKKPGLRATIALEIYLNL
jgi:Tfp pilus assembly protein PilO